MAGSRLEFHSKETSQSAFRTGTDRVVYSLRRYTRRASERETEDVSAGSMLVKLGICALACALVLLINGRDKVSVYTGAMQEEEKQEEREELDETLGRLRFVELPGLLTVFAGNDATELPIACSAYETMEENTLLCMVSAQNQTVNAPEDCTVKSIGQEETYGNYVSVRSADDREWVYYGLARTGVEEGQPLSARDVLGEVARGDKLYVRLLRAGRPTDLRDELDLQNGV